MTSIGKILAVVHHGPGDVGAVGSMLTAAGFEMEICSPTAGDTLPDNLTDYAGATIFGGVMSANDDHLPAIRLELDWIPKVIKSGCPLFGICLGGQLIARALGARVYKQPQDIWEVGYVPVNPTPAGAHVFPNGVQHFYSWHQDGFDVPAGAELLGTGADIFPNQAFRFGASAYGIQFHPEAPSKMFTKWMESSPEFESLAGAHGRERQLTDAGQYEDLVDVWLSGFLEMWLDREGSRAEVQTG